MELKCQQQAMNNLAQLAESGRQSILVEGPQGCGKSYLAKQFATILMVSDFVTVLPKVADIREAIDGCYNIKNPVVIAIENLDLGVPAASYTLLKFLEEPLPYVYIVVTCRNLKGVPDTIISRSAVVSVDPPTQADLVTYASQMDYASANLAHQRSVWSLTRTFQDVDEVLHMTPDQLSFFDKTDAFTGFRDSVSTIVWNWSHYTDGKECNIAFSIRKIMELNRTPFVTKSCLDTLRELSTGRVAQHAILSKLAFNLKYCE